jgi:hypothetical protein
LRLPDRISELDFSFDQVVAGPYPPRGFLPVWDAELGNGDYFGLYWPLGRETVEPIVCEMHHDGGIIVPEFSGVAAFAEWLTENGEDRGGLPIEEPTFAPSLYRRARQAIEANDPPRAIDFLTSACESLPEVPQYWSALSSQLRRVGRKEEGYSAALRSFLSGWHFGRPDDSVLRMLKAAYAEGALTDDPIVSRAEALTNRFGGEKENANYGLLRAAIDDYFSQGASINALSLSQNYAYMMTSETTAFQDRHNFKLETWRSEFAAACTAHLGDDRSAMS